MAQLLRHWTRRLAAAVLAIALVLPAVGLARAQGASERDELAPTGVLRVGVLFNNPNIAGRDPASGVITPGYHRRDQLNTLTGHE